MLSNRAAFLEAGDSLKSNDLLLPSVITDWWFKVADLVEERIKSEGFE